MASKQILLASHKRLEARHAHFCEVGRILSGGGMIGSAFLFPLANAGDGAQFRALTLSIFIVSILAFHAIHIEPFLIYGPFTAPVALIVVIIVMISGGASKLELLPWLPLYLVGSCLTTVAVFEISTHIVRRNLTRRDRTVSWVNESDHGIGSEYQGPGARAPPSQSFRDDPNYFGHTGPASHSSHRTEHDTASLSLGSVAGVAKSDWGQETLNFFPGKAQKTVMPPSHLSDDIESRRISQDSTVGSNAPLLDDDN